MYSITDELDIFIVYISTLWPFHISLKRCDSLPIVLCYSQKKFSITTKKRYVNKTYV